MKMPEKNDIQCILDEELSHVHTSDCQRQMLCENAKGEKAVKKKGSFVLILALALTLVSCAALAATGAFEALKAMWENSFQRMNTTAQVDIVDESEVPGYLQQFEAEYGGRKEDLILSTVPGESDLSLEEAVRIARDAIMNKFGTPQSELDRMGIYPSFYKSPYQDREPQWRIYITPRTDVNLDDDHDYPAPGEYLVDIDSPSGEVNSCFWYNDDYWPEYAIRCWENGSRDDVYEQAKRPDFMKQSMESRQQFMDLFAQAGYDLAPLQMIQSDEARLRAMDTYICYAEIENDLLDSSDSFVQTAIREMESRFGITKEDMIKCHFAAVLSPQNSETVDICFSYNFNKEAAAQPGLCEMLGAGYGTRLGYFMICMDAQSGKAVRAVNIMWDETLLPTCESGLLSRMFWTKEDLPEYYRMLKELCALDAGYVAGRDSQSALLNEADRVMLSYGGEPGLYTTERTEEKEYTIDQFLYEHEMTGEEIIQKGFAFLLSHTACSEEELKQAVFLVGTMFDDMENPDPDKIHPTLLVLMKMENDQEMRWYFHFDLDLNVTRFEETRENING